MNRRPRAAVQSGPSESTSRRMSAGLAKLTISLTAYADTRHSCSQSHGCSATSEARHFCINLRAHNHIEGSREGDGE